MIALERIVDLDISAASGLALHGEQLCVVADDELFLAVYDPRGVPLRRVALFGGELPESYAERKKAKPDLEALAVLPDQRLLALGSGSTPQRMRGALIDPSDNWRMHAIDLAPLYRVLDARIADMNIEGAAVVGDRLFLGQRGNGPAGIHALIELDLPHVLDTIERERAIAADALRAVRPLDLGRLERGKLGITDLAPHPGRAALVFSAAAEASASTYDDGEVEGSALGILALDGRVELCVPVAPACKIEGLSVLSFDVARGALELRLVADADDRTKLAPLYRATLPARASS